MIKHRSLEYFEFHQLQHLLEILFYYATDLESRKVQEKMWLVWFWEFGGPITKTGQTLRTSSFLQLCKFPNLTNSKRRYLNSDPLDFTQKAPLVLEL
jgi:hypothetical protein